MIALVLITAGALSFRMAAVTSGKIKGQIEPSNSVAKVVALSASDTFKAHIANGYFEIENVKPGEYTLSIEAIPPYQSVSQPGVQVAENTTTDIGIIWLDSLKVY